MSSHKDDAYIHPITTTTKQQQSPQSKGGIYPGQESDPKTHPQQYDLAVVEKTLGAKQKLKFPAVANESPVQVEDLPRLLQGLILPEGSGIEVASIRYNNAEKGYKLSYKLASTMNYHQISGAFRGLLGSDKAAGEWNEVYGFLERTDASAEVRVVWRRPEIGVYTIEVQSMNL